MDNTHAVEPNPRQPDVQNQALSEDESAEVIELQTLEAEVLAYPARTTVPSASTGEILLADSTSEHQSLSANSNDVNIAVSGAESVPEVKTSWWGRRKAWWKRRFAGWRGGVVLAISATSFVLLLNIIFAIIAGAAHHSEPGFTTIYRGSCEVYERTYTGLKVLVNIFSTVLLGASNYCMQRLVAPTRSEIDAAHAKRRFLDIGKPSLRNLFSINWVRIVLWSLLLLSSLPLHLFYNSVLIKDQATYNGIAYLVVDPSIFTGNDKSWTEKASDFSRLDDMISDGKYLDSTVWKNLTADECREVYEASFMTRGYAFGVPAQSWREERFDAGTPVYIWTRTRDGGSIPVDSDPDPSPTPFPLDYCLSQEVPPRCAIQFSLTVIGIVIACGFVKIVTMFVILYRFTNEGTIVTIGDGVQSFMLTPDTTTRNLCLETRHGILDAWKTPLDARRGTTFHKPSRQSWFRAASAKRWSVPIILFFVSTSVAIWIATGHTEFCDNYMVLKPRCYVNKFGKLDPHYLLDLDSLRNVKSIVPYALVANTPQLIASTFYFTYNGLFTSMLANREWSRYSVKRAALRVSTPKPGQRSSYFIQVPWAYGVPLMSFSMLFHFFISQTIFVSRVVSYDALDPDKPIGTPDKDLGYSLYALIATLIWSAALIVTSLMFGVIGKYPAEGMPTGGTNSVVISAACHVENPRTQSDEIGEEDSVVVRPLKWGVTREGSKEMAGHCSFSDEEVNPPTVGHLYAGLSANSPPSFSSYSTGQMELGVKIPQS